MDGPRLADALWACMEAHGQRELVPEGVVEGGSEGYRYQSAASRRWAPWLRLSDCYPAMRRYGIGIEWQVGKVGLVLSRLMIGGVCPPRVVVWVPSHDESAVAEAICRLAVQLWKEDHD